MTLRELVRSLAGLEDARGLLLWGQLLRIECALVYLALALDLPGEVQVRLTLLLALCCVGTQWHSLPVDQTLIVATKLVGCACSGTDRCRS